MLFAFYENVISATLIIQQKVFKSYTLGAAYRVVEAIIGITVFLLTVASHKYFGFNPLISFIFFTIFFYGILFLYYKKPISSNDSELIYKFKKKKPLVKALFIGFILILFILIPVAIFTAILLNYFNII